MNEINLIIELEKLKELIERFNNNIEIYKSSRYDEENTKIDFIDKFFGLLGWDVYNSTGASEDFREVIREDKVVIQGRPKSPDYSFKIGRERQFFVEAKKPIVNIHDDVHSAFQLRRYAYTAGLPISILTDFEEFSIYDSSIKPKESDNASVARIFYCKYTDYVKHWDFINETISKQAVWQGKLKKYTADNTKKKGTQSVDKELLQLIETWRLELARNIALRNKELDIYQLNEAVQTIIDRIIFLRMAEDRNTEIYATLQKHATQKNIYEILVQYFQSANNKYNSGLFASNLWMDSLVIEDKIFKSIINNLYYPMPYEFSVLPIEILGQIYEQFLGKTITLSSRHVASVEEKPEVRKAGGVYYTPKYIVDYIVENTVGKKIENKAPKDIETLSILDTACGSGSFLVGAYKFLLQYHLEYYKNNGIIKKAVKEGRIYEAGKNDLRLSIREKKKILLNNIYGVDIDKQAVEVTKLSLLLTLMEGEIVESRGELFLKSISEALLPNLDNNIKCGNSLIGTDFYADKNLELFDRHEQRKLNCFDWEEEFPQIFKGKKERFDKEYFEDNLKKGVETAKAAIDISKAAFKYINTSYEYAKKFDLVKEPEIGYYADGGGGGFDVVIGNPPYVNAINLVEIYQKERDYLTKSKKFKSTYQKWDLYIPFIEKGLNLLKDRGYLSMIIPYPFTNQLYAKILRELIINQYKLIEIADLSNEKVFKDAVVTNCIIVISNDKSTDNISISKINNQIIQFSETKKIDDLVIDKKNYVWDLQSGRKNLIKNLSYKTLGDYCFISKGMVLNADEYKAKGKFKKEDLISDIKTEIYIKEYTEAKDIERFYINRIRFLEWNTKRIPTLISRPTFPELYEVPKIMITKIGNLKGTIDLNNLYCDQTIRILVLWKFLKGINNKSINNSIKRWYNFSRVELESNSKNINYCYLLGIINSKLGNYFLNEIRGVGNIDINPEYLKNIPIRTIDFTNKTEKAQHDRMVSLVEQMLEAQKEAHSDKNITDTDKKLINQRIKILDKQIDNLVYELYGLTEEEIKIVEGE
ncbi:MAG: hypothetical protein HW421_2376 [Ignavibacteria bacterium]|nr:hypothetical protein [Ignavibacteria bacterium]